MKPKEAGKEMNSVNLMRELRWSKSRLPSLVFIAAVMASGVSAYGQQATIISGDLLPTPTYQGAPNYDWNIPATGFNNGAVVLDTIFPSWVVSPTWGPQGSASWGAHDLDQDTSAGGLAAASFDAGGVFSISGAVYDNPFQAFANLLHDGDVFIADAGNFVVEETATNTNKLVLNGTVTLVPTGGYLFDQGLLAPAYEMSFQAVDAEQGFGGNLADFQTDITMITVLQFTMFAVPEPASVLSLLAGGCLLLVRRRR